MTSGSSKGCVRTGVSILFTISVACILLTTASPVAAHDDQHPAEYEYDASELLIEGSVTQSGETISLLASGTAREGETIRIELDDDHPGFEIAAVADATDGSVGVDLHYTADAIEIELTDLGGDGSLDDAEIDVDVDLTATDDVAGYAAEYDSTPIATVTADETNGDLVGETAIRVTLDGSAAIEFDADVIGDAAEDNLLPVRDNDWFTIEFSSDSVHVADGDIIQLSVNQTVKEWGDESGIAILYAWESATQNKNISSIDVTTSGDANVLDGYDDQITVTIETVDGDPKLVSGEAVALGIQIAVEKESMKYAADRYRGVDFLTVDVEGEDNAGLTDNADVRTESPVVLDIYPGEATDGFDLDGLESGAEFGIGEGRTVAVDRLEDRFGNAIPRADFEFAIDAQTDHYTVDGIELATDGTGGFDLGSEGEISVPLGVFALSATVVDAPGPTDADTGVVETVSDLAVYPDDVTVSTTTGYRDFDVGQGGTIEVAVDLGVSDEDVDRVDLELRRESGTGSVTFQQGGTPTPTELWEETGYGGDDHLGVENPWAIERDLTAADFDDGVRRYVLDADSADRFEIGVTVMPHDGAIEPDPSDVETTLAVDPGGVNRDTTEIVATGAIDAVADVSPGTDREFVGIEADEGGSFEIELGGFEDANGNAITDTDDTVSVTFGGASVGAVGPSDGADAVTVTVDPTTVDTGEIDVGTDANVTVGVSNDVQRIETDITLVHRVVERQNGTWQPGSLSQPATLYVDGRGDRDLVQWNPNTERYAGVGSGGGGDTLGAHRIDHEDLHRGFYAYADAGVLRIGFEYVTTADESIGTREIELEPGWHFGSSNYDVSAHDRRELGDDLNWVGYDFAGDAFVVWNGERTERLHDTTEGIDTDGSAEPIDHDGTYWIEIDGGDDAPLTRTVVSPTFSEGDGLDG